MNIKKIIYNLFFKKKKSSRSRKKSDRANDNAVKTSSATSRKKRVTEKRRYDTAVLRKQVSESEYISNLRIGRSWILPQLVKMGFNTKRRKNVFDMDYLEKMILCKYNDSQTGRRKMWDLLKRNYKVIADTNQTSKRKIWWTEVVFRDVIENDFARVGKRSTGLNRKECMNILKSIDGISDPTQIYNAINRYDSYRMRKRKLCGTLPNSFIDAYMGDGAYHAMMTMVKTYDLRFDNDNGSILTRDECISIINEQAEMLNGHELMEFCKEKFFDSGLFDYKTYVNKK